MTADVKVNDADIQKYYDENTRRSTRQAASRDVRHILVKHEGAGRQIDAQLKAGADFAKLAKKNSTDTLSAGKGGKLTIAKGKTVAGVRQGSVRAQDERDLDADQDAVRLAHHPGARRRCKAATTEAARAGQGADPAEAPADEEDRRDQRSGSTA